METHNFGKKLIELRKSKGLTQGDVAAKCNLTVRTIQRIESGMVQPRAYTIKLISESLGFDFFEHSETGAGNRNLMWFIKDLFNFKTNAMRKISILSTSVIILVFLCVNIISAAAQSANNKQQSLIVELNKDKTVKKVEATFSRNLTFDSLFQIKKDLQALNIVLNYKKIEFDVHNLLVELDCEVICNDGFSGSFGTGDLRKQKSNTRIGFYRDYANIGSPFGTGILNKEIK